MDVSKIILLAWLATANVRSYTITAEDPLLPTQRVFDKHSLIRFTPGRPTRVIVCAGNTYLNRGTATCDFGGGEQEIENVQQQRRLRRKVVVDILPAEDCRKFLLCGPSGGCIEMTCPGTLFFDTHINTCDRNSNCCEFPERNSTRILQDPSLDTKLS